jgi:hypothetical protein
MHSAPRPEMNIPVNITAGVRAILAFIRPQLAETEKHECVLLTFDQIRASFNSKGQL